MVKPSLSGEDSGEGDWIVARNASGVSLIAASVILGASIVGGSFLIKSSLDRTAGELNEVFEALRAAPQPPPPQRAARPGRPDPNRRYQIAVGSAPVKGPKTAAVTLVEWADFQ
jgi:hypothetical protein